MVKEDEVCNDDFDDYDTLQYKYNCLFNNFEKLMHKCKDFQKTIISLTLELDHAKNEYEILIENRNNLQNVYDNAKSEIEALKLELKNKDKTLLDYLNEKVALKMSIDEK